MAVEYKKTIAVLFTDLASCDCSLPFSSKSASRVHSIFSQKAEEHNLRMIFANHREYENGRLKRAWIRRKNKWMIIKDQEVDLIYSRFALAMFRDNKEHDDIINFKLNMAGQVSLINHPIIDKFCWDKRIVSEFFPEYCPKTFIISSLEGLKAVLPAIKTEEIVLKPRYGTLGEKVIITRKDNLPDSIENNTIIQEFVDTSKGIEGLTKGYHDLRLIMINGKVDHAHIRIPKKGLLTANVALGGKKVFIKNEQIPKKAVQIAKKIDKLFRKYRPRVYSVDFLLDKSQNPYVVECNSQPMIDKYAYGKYVDLSFYDRILKVMKKGIKLKVIETI